MRYRRGGAFTADAVREGALARLYSVLMTRPLQVSASADCALASTSASADVQRPLAIVVIGRLIISTILTLARATRPLSMVVQDGNSARAE